MMSHRAFEAHDDPMATGAFAATQRRSAPESQSWARDKDALTKWAFGVVTTASLALGGWLWSGFNSHETRLVTVETQQKIDTVARAEEQRRSDEQRRLDASVRAEEQRRLDARFDRIENRFDRSERKLDEVLMWQRRDLHSPDQAPPSR